MTLTTLALPVQAKKTIIPFEYGPVLLQRAPDDVPVQKLSGDEHLIITTYQHYEAVYDGPLGIGTMYSDLIVTIMDNPSINPVGTGHSTYNYTLEINDGPYGEGTLSGHLNAIIDFDFTVSPPRIDVWGNASLKQGTGDLKGIKMNFDVHGIVIGPTEALQFQTGEIILP